MVLKLNKKALIFMAQFSIGFYFLLSFPSLSQSADVTLSVGSDSGYVGSRYYNNNNKVDISLNLAPTIEVTDVWLNVIDGSNYLSITGCKTTEHTSDFTCYFEPLPDGRDKVRLVAGVGAVIEESGPICTVEYDVSDQAPGGGAYRNLDLQVVYVKDNATPPETIPPEDIATVSGKFYFYNCTSDQDCDSGEACIDDVCDTGKCVYLDRWLCDDGEFCNGFDFCFLKECTHAGYPCATLLCDEVKGCYCDANEQCDDDKFCTGVETCNIGTGDCQPGNDPCSGLTPECDEFNDVCYAYDNITLDIGNGSGVLDSTNIPVPVYLENPGDTIRGISFDVCDVGDSLACTACNPVGRATGFTNCETNENTESGCCEISLFDQHNPPLIITAGSKSTILNITYDVKKASEGASTGYEDLNPDNIQMQDTCGLNANQTACKAVASCQWKTVEEQCVNKHRVEPPNVLYAHPEKGVFYIYCNDNYQCDDGLWCNGVEYCLDPNCKLGTPPCTPPSCCDEESHCLDNTDDYECDGVEDSYDNCRYVVNPDQKDADGSCNNSPYWPMPYEDDPHCGDACECELCQEYQGKYQICLDKKNEGRTVDYDACKALTNQGKTVCEQAECYWNPQGLPQGACIVDLCLSNSDFNSAVDGKDLGVYKKELFRVDCPYATGGDLCEKYSNLYNYCVDLCSVGRNLDYDACKALTNQGEDVCERAGCYWNPQGLPYGACVVDLCLSNSDFNSAIDGKDLGVYKKELFRVDCP